jgi:hypothetical protein
MKHSVKFSALTIIAPAVLAVSGSAIAAVAMDANIELDNTHRSGSAVAAGDKGLSQSGRVELNASGKAGTKMFVAGKAAFLAKKDGGVAADDMWIQVGSAGGDIKLGRFEAADLFPIAQDTVVNHAGNVYGTNALRGRKDMSQFHAAGTLNLGSGLALELGVVENKTAAKGLRPVVSFASGALTARVGIESGKYASGNKFSGFGATAGYNFGAFTLTGNFAKGETDTTSSRNGQNAMAVTAAMGPLALGIITAKTEAAVRDDKVRTMYASYSMPLFDIKGASITPALSSSTGKTGAGVETKENALRVRLNYAF